MRGTHLLAFVIISLTTCAESRRISNTTCGTSAAFYRVADNSALDTNPFLETIVKSMMGCLDLCIETHPCRAFLIHRVHGTKYNCHLMQHDHMSEGVRIISKSGWMLFDTGSEDTNRKIGPYCQSLKTNPCPIGCSCVDECDGYRCDCINPLLSPEWTTGDGSGGSEELIEEGVASKQHCYDICSTRTKDGVFASGATIDAATEKRCFCEFGQNAVASSNVYINSVIKRPVFKSCQLAVESVNSSTHSWIKHDAMTNAVRVRCIKKIDGSYVALLDHDSEDRTKVSGFEERGSYKRSIKYGALSDIIAFVDSSTSCKQHIKIEGSGMYLSDNGYLVDRSGTHLSGFGVPKGISGCQCGLTNSCIVSSIKCNVDKNDDSHQMDEGDITDKESLPVTEIRLGDTGDSSEYGYHTLGKVECIEN